MGLLENTFKLTKPQNQEVGLTLAVAPETMVGLKQWQSEERTWHEVSGAFADT